MRITNIDNLSALLDRLATERIKEYNFDKQGKDTEAAHQREVVIEIKIKLNELFREVFETNSYEYVSEKRTFDEAKLLDDVETLIVNDLDVGDAYYTKTEGEPTSIPSSVKFVVAFRKQSVDDIPDVYSISFKIILTFGYSFCADSIIFLSSK